MTRVRREGGTETGGGSWGGGMGVSKDLKAHLAAIPSSLGCSIAEALSRAPKGQVIVLRGARDSW